MTGEPCNIIVFDTAAPSDHRAKVPELNRWFPTASTYQLTNIAALFSAMNGSSPQTLQKPNSNVHHSRIFTLWRRPPRVHRAQQAVR